MPLPQGRKILIVEDDSLIGWSMARALGSAGFETEVVECGEAAFEKIAKGGYTLVISDIRLPRMDGLEFAGRLRKLPHSVPLIIISAHEEFAATDVESVEGVDHFIEKPFKLTELVNVVEGLIGVSGLKSENFWRT